jgi:hypothetical protein
MGKAIFSLAIAILFISAECRSQGCLAIRNLFEGAPAHDLFGENDGLRMAGHIFSIEPGMEYKFKSSFLYSFVNIPISRETYQNVPDQRATALTGNYTTTGGNFASSIFFLGYAFTF